MIHLGTLDFTEADCLASRHGPPDAVPRLARMLASSSRIAVLTGAALSAASGLRDHEATDGCREAGKPIGIEEFIHDRTLRLRQWERSLSDATAFLAAMPNEGHLALARLARERDVVLMTRNTDGLHRRSGFPEDRLLELHGDGMHARCMKCGALSPIMAHGDRIRAGRSPVCEGDGQLLKPNVPLFGEAMDKAVVAIAERSSHACGLFILVGTPLVEYPEAHQPGLAKRAGARLVVMVDGPTYVDGDADLIVRGDAPSALARAVDLAFGVDG